MIQAHRQPGSTFKPFVYLAAFEAIFEDPALPPFTLATILEDEPLDVIVDGKPWSPENYDQRYRGPVTLRRALQRIRSTSRWRGSRSRPPASCASHRPGARSRRREPAAADSVARARRVRDDDSSRLRRTYGVLASGGMLRAPRARRSRCASPAAATLARRSRSFATSAPSPEGGDVPRDVRADRRRRERRHRGASLRALGCAAHSPGKTGTTNDLRDAWFAGYTPELVVVAWVGFDYGARVGLTAAQGAIPIWVEFMKGAVAGTQAAAFRRAAGERDLRRHRQGHRACSRPPAARSVISEAFIAGTEPLERCPLH